MAERGWWGELDTYLAKKIHLALGHGNLTTIEQGVSAEESRKLRGLKAKPSKEEIAKFNPQDFLMDRIEHFASWSIQNNPIFRYIMPIVGGMPAEINQHFIGTPGIDRFMNIDAKAFAQITPKIDLFKVFYPDPEKGNKGVDVPIPFNKTLTENEKIQILDNQQSRGIGSGIISFDWEMDGKNPVEARTHIKANLKIFLKSIAELDKIRATYETDATTHYVKYLDFIHQERKELKDVKLSSGAIVDKYNPNYFLLKANVGWRTNSSTPKLLKDSLEKCQTTMYLALYKHEIEFNDDGSVILTCNYIGYIASLLSGMSLFDPPTVENLPTQLIGQSNVERFSIVTENYQNIIKDLMGLRGNGRLYVARVRRREIKNNLGDIVDVQYHLDNNLATYYAQTTAEEPESAMTDFSDDPATATTEKVLNKLKDQVTGIEGDTIKWFYFGDLLDTILGYVYTKEEMSRVRFLLGPIIVQDSFGQKIGINLCDVPISLDMYQIWFQEKILNEKLEKLSIGKFLQMIFDTLIKAALLSGRNQRRQRTELKIPKLTISQFSLPEMASGLDPITLSLKPRTNSPRVNWKEFGKKALFSKPPSPETEYYHYFFIHSANERVYERSKDKDDGIAEKGDNKNGIYYFSTGRKNNVVRTVKFKKQDVPHLTEANLELSGIKNGILRGFYDATITLEGAPIFKPGMIIYIDGAAMAAGDVTTLGAISRRLGFGGYYNVLKVSHEINQGNFETNLECTWLSFGTKESTPIHFYDSEQGLEQKLKNQKAEDAARFEYGTASPGG